MRWRNYKHRFVPWVAANWSDRLVKYSDKTDLEQKQRVAIKQLFSILTILSNTLPQLLPRDVDRLLSQQERYDELRAAAVRAVHNAMGTVLSVEPSAVCDGNGVYVREGQVHDGQLVALYPGTVYYPHDPKFFQSLNNPYFLRCTDGTYIDGKHCGLSKWIYRSCGFRDVVGRYMSCDLSWLTLEPLNPLSIGQIVNNQTRDSAANVDYLEMDVERHVRQQQLIPNISYSPHLDSPDSSRVIRVVGLIATRHIYAGEELYSPYYSVVT